MEIGRDQFKKVLGALERQADAAEGLLEIATREEMVVERGPSICPGCGAFNPNVTQLVDEGGSGPLDEFVMRCETHCCNKIVYCIADAWAVTLNRDEASFVIEMRKKGGGNGQQNP